MHYSTKRGMEWSGYKVHVTETCEATAVNLITHVETRPAMDPDMNALAGIHARLAQRELLPDEHFVDSGYINAELLVSSQRDHGVFLQGPVRGLSAKAVKAEQGYDLPQFVIDWERDQVTCPQGHVSVGWSAKSDPTGQTRIYVRFGRADCGACEARPSCTTSKEARRTLFFHPREQHEALNAARARMHDPEWKQRYRVRAGVAGCAGIRHTSQPLHRHGQDRVATGTGSRRHQHGSYRCLARRQAQTGGHSHIPLRSAGSRGCLNSPTVSR